MTTRPRKTPRRSLTEVLRTLPEGAEPKPAEPKAAKPEAAAPPPAPPLSVPQPVPASAVSAPARLLAAFGGGFGAACAAALLLPSPVALILGAYAGYRVNRRIRQG